MRAAPSLRVPAALLSSALALAACQRPLPPQVMQPVPPPLGARAPAVVASKLQPAPRDGLRGLEAITSCNLENAAGARFGAAPVRLYRRAPAPLSGWAALGSSPPQRVHLLALSASDPGHAWQVELPTGVVREDVAAYFRSPAMRRSGFAAHVDFSALAPGRYRLLLLYGDGPQRRRCDNDRRVQLVD